MGKYKSNCPCIDKRVCSKCDKQVCYEVHNANIHYCDEGYLNPEGLCITCEED